MNFILSLLPYLLFRILRSIFYFLHDRVFKLVPDSRCQVQKILWGKKYADWDIGRPCDFLAVHQNFADPRTLLQPNWSLYAFCSKFAHFVELRKAEREYTAEKAVFAYVEQFTDAVRVARVTLAQLVELGESWGDPECRVVLLHHTPRSGSTLLAQMIATCPKAIVVSEDNATTALSILKDDFSLAPEIMNKLVLATIRFQCRNFAKDEKFVIKLMSICSNLAPNFRLLLPAIPQVFLLRENAVEGMTSGLKWIQCYQVFRDIRLLEQISKRLARSLIGMARIGDRYSDTLRIQDELEYSFFIFAFPYVHFLAHASLYTESPLTYERLLRKPEDILVKIFDLCLIPHKTIPEALRCFKRDSQAGSFISKNAMKWMEEPKIDRAKMDRFKAIAHSIGFPDAFLWPQTT